jgi:predicted ATPase
MHQALGLHDEIVAEAIAECDGTVVKHTGDGFLAAFEVAEAALTAAVELQRRLTSATWPGTGQALAVRVSIHTGDAERRGNDYFGLTVNQTARLNGLAHGGQILLSDATRLTAGSRVPEIIGFRSLGPVALRGVSVPLNVHQLLHPDLPDEFPPLVTNRRPVPLPVVAGPLIGRSAEVQAALRAVASSRVVTLIGMGGVGKTRLALEVAGAVDEQLDGEVWWCDLATVTDPGAVAHVALAAGGVPQGRAEDPIKSFAAAVGDRRLLLVVDNAEHVLDTAAILVSAVARGCSRTTVLCTSREPLSVPGEEVIALAPLAVDADGTHMGPAIDLFVQRAIAANPRFALTEENRVAVAEVCRKLDGLPLALEIAAARVRSLSPQEICDLLLERFRLLQWERRGATDRHRSVEAAMEWSFDLLDPRHQDVFQRLSVFVGSFDASGAHAVVGAGVDRLDVVDVLDRLARRSMLEVIPSERTRYRLLETLRAYGRARLEHGGALEDTLARWAAHYVGFAEQADQGVQGPQIEAWILQMREEFPNLRAGHQWAMAAGDVDVALRLSVALGEYAYERMSIEVGLWAAEAIAMPGAADHPLWASANGVAAQGAWLRGSPAQARSFAEAGLAVAPSDWRLTNVVGLIALYEGDVARAQRQYEVARAIAADAGDDFHLARALGEVGFVRYMQGDTEAAGFAEAAVEVAATTRNRQAQAHAAWALGVCLFRRAPELALKELQRAMDLAVAVDAQMTFNAAADTLEQLEGLLAQPSVVEEIAATVRRATYWGRISNVPVQWGAVRDLAELLARNDDLELAVVLHGAWEKAGLKTPLSRHGATAHQKLMGDVRTELGDDRWSRAVARGRALSQEELMILLQHIAADAERVARG